MTKKGQIQTQFLKYVIAVAVIAVIFLFGYNSIRGLQERKCNSEYATFMQKLRTSSRGLIFNEERAKVFDLPCKVDKVVFVDSSIDKPISALEDYPLINDALETGSANVFLFSEGLIKKSFSMPNIKAGFPYFACYRTGGNKMRVVLVSDENMARVMIKDPDADCTTDKPVSIELKEEDLEEIIEELEDEGLEIDEEKVITEEECEILRSFEEKDGEVEVRITKGDCTEGSFVFFESIPKCAINSIADAIAAGQLQLDMPGWEAVKDDPILKWTFNPAEDDDYIYILKKLIEEGCRQDFKGFGVRSEGVTTPPHTDGPEPPPANDGGTPPADDTTIVDQRDNLPPDSSPLTPTQ
jgi:hypothetical protein